MPIAVCRAATVLSPNGLILLGGQERIIPDPDPDSQERNGKKVRISDIILEIAENSDQSLEWKIIPQTMHIARSYPIASLIPDNLTSCSNITSTSTPEESMELDEILTRSDDFFIPLKILLMIVICGIISFFAFIIGNKYYHFCYKKDNEKSTDKLLIPLTMTNFLFEENSHYEKLVQSLGICRIPLELIQIKIELGMQLSYF